MSLYISIYIIFSRELLSNKLFIQHVQTIIIKNKFIYANNNILIFIVIINNFVCN